MIKLSEILHTIKDERKKGLTPIDRWNILHVDFLEDMDFKADGIDHYSLEKPKIKVSHRKGIGFIVEDKSKGKTHSFKTFKEMAEFFSTYKQKWENAPYQEEENNSVE